MTQEALRMALDFVETVHVGEWVGSIERQLEVITAVKKALAQTQEPVAWMHVQGNYKEPSFRELADDEVERGWEQYPLYNTPPQRTWVGLTKEQLATTDWSSDFRAGALWAEAKLKEANT